MNTSVILSLLVVFLGTFKVECRKCFTSSRMKDGKCPVSRPKCCGSRLNGRHNRCATSCVHFKCQTNFDCDGLTCCGGNCSKSKNCLPVTTWGVVGIAVVCLIGLVGLFRACQLCYKRNTRTRESTGTTNEEPANHERAFVVSEFANDGFIAPMAPPTYESVVRDTEPRTEGDPPVYNLNLQTIINNSSTNNSGANNFELNISIRGSAMFINDFPPSYSEISNSRDDNGEPVSRDSSQENALNLDITMVTHSYGDEPPPYNLNEESTTEESPNEESTTEESTNIPGNELVSSTTTGADNLGINPNIDEDFTVGEEISSDEIRTVSNSFPEIDTERSLHSSVRQNRS